MGYCNKLLFYNPLLKVKGYSFFVVSLYICLSVCLPFVCSLVRIYFLGCICKHGQVQNIEAEDDKWGAILSFIIPRFWRSGVSLLSSVHPVRPSITNICRRTFLSNHASQPLHTWYGALARVLHPYTSLTKFTSASYLLPVFWHSLFFNITWSSARFSSLFAGVY